MILGLSGCGAQKTVPDVTGKNFTEATSALAKEGFAYEAQDGSGQPAVDGTVTEQDPKGGTKTDATKVKLTVRSSADAAQERAAQKRKEKAEKKAQQQNSPAPAEKSTSGGLTQTYAQSACDQRGQQEFPYGYKPHYMTAGAEPMWSPDSVMLQYKATVKNGYNAKRDVTVTCNVRGSNDHPEVFGWLAQ
ncbi:PASTA domain-containing protein [Bifidobacterium actinocoloniiforme]|nr:PASTA domain-containing protein [Bifidobacterium actinocoloniiforme]